jgi:hypothetical protein
MKKIFLFIVLLSILSITIVSAGNCRQNGDEEWCCDDSSYVICGNTNVCGPSSSWCNNYLNGGSKTCMPGTDWCCYDSGAILDYSHHGNSYGCCPSDYPFLGEWAAYSSGYGCFKTPQTISDNWYTKQSDCKLTTESKCDGINFYKCEESPSYIYTYKYKGPTKGKCGVDCTNSNDCQQEVLGDKFCQDNTALLQKSKSYTCENYKCVEHNQDKLIESCSYKCQNAECIPKVCDENQLRCNVETNSTEMCTNNTFVTVQKCNFGCNESGQCNSKINLNFYLWVGISSIIAVICIIILVVYIIKKS